MSAPWAGGYPAPYPYGPDAAAAHAAYYGAGAGYYGAAPGYGHMGPWYGAPRPPAPPPGAPPAGAPPTTASNGADVAAPGVDATQPTATDVPPPPSSPPKGPSPPTEATGSAASAQTVAGQLGGAASGGGAVSSTPAPPTAPPPTTPAAGTPAAAAAAAAYDMAAYHQYYAAYYGSGGGAPYGGAPPYGYPQYPVPYPQATHYPAAAPQHAYPPAGPPPPEAAPPAPAPKSKGGVAAGGVTSYNAVPPPAALAAPRPPAGTRQPITIRPAAGFTVQKRPVVASTAAGPLHAQAPKPTPAAAAAPAYTPAAAASTPKATAPAAAAKPATAAAGGSSAAGSKFPPTFTAWVERCFSYCRADWERQAMSDKLTARIREVEASGRMWLTDWDREPMPNLTASAPTAAAAATPGAAGPVLRAKRSRWEDSADAQATPPAPPAYGNAAWAAASSGGKATKKQKKAAAAAAAAAAGGGADPQWAAEASKRAARAGRFGDGRAAAATQQRRRHRIFDPEDDGMHETDSSGDSDDGGLFRSQRRGGARFDPATAPAIQGTCTALEKSYFRLTGPPDPAVVRPPTVLRAALDRLVRLIRQSAVSHFYVLDQFKGMRQDCTVQHLRNELSVAVYEAHARASLEYGDLAEFNQCQTQLAAMYGAGIPGSVPEFLMYRILYNSVHSRAGGAKDLLHTLRTAAAFQAGRGAAASGGEGDAVALALRARAAVAAADCPAFFKAYAAMPALGRALLDALAPRLRWETLNVVVRSYKGTAVPVSFLVRVLGFLAPPATASGQAGEQQQQQQQAGSDGEVGLPGCKNAVCVGRAAGAADEATAVEACAAWLTAHGAVLEGEGTPSPMLDTKASSGKLFIPEEPKVAHGDENLSLHDFLSRASGLRP